MIPWCSRGTRTSRARHGSKPVDAMGKPLAPAEVAKLYPQARVITAGWDATSLSAI